MDEIIIRVSTVQESNMVEISEPMQNLIRAMIDSLIEEDVRKIQEEQACQQT